MKSTKCTKQMPKFYEMQMNSFTVSIQNLHNKSLLSAYEIFVRLCGVSAGFSSAAIYNISPALKNILSHGSEVVVMQGYLFASLKYEDRGLCK